MTPRDRSDDPDISLAMMVVVVGTVLTFTVVVFLSAVFFSAEDAEIRRKIVDETPRAIGELRAEQNEVLGSYRWIDREAGIVAIPIDRAMEMMIERDRTAPLDGGD